MSCITANNTSFRSLLADLFSSDDANANEDAETLKRHVKEVRHGLAQSVVLGEPDREILLAIEEAYNECKVDNWDGYGAKSVKYRNYYKSQQFVEILPTWIPTPEVTVEPDGEIALEWNEGPRQVFTVSIGPNNELTYAGLFGRARVYGIEYFDNELPKTILENINRVTS